MLDWHTNSRKNGKKITGGSSTLIHQHIVLVDNFDVRFVEICLVCLIF